MDQFSRLADCTPPSLEECLNIIAELDSLEGIDDDAALLIAKINFPIFEMLVAASDNAPINIAESLLRVNAASARALFQVGYQAAKREARSAIDKIKGL